MQLGWENMLGFSEVYVIFEDSTTLWWLKFLKQGFRHCYVLLVSRERKAVIQLNPRSNQVDVILYTMCDIDVFLASYLQQQEIHFCRAHIDNAPLKCAPIMLFTCVEFVKRILGIHDFSIITPYKLYNKLKIVGNIS